MESWIFQTVKRFGKLDGAANIAGVIPKAIGIDSMAEQDLDDWNFVFSVSSELLTCHVREMPFVFAILINYISTRSTSLA